MSGEQQQSGRRIVVQAPEHVREAVHAILVGHMAGHLLQQQVSLRDPIACKVSLLSAGFGETSVDALLERARKAARPSR